MLSQFDPQIRDDVPSKVAECSQFWMTTFDVLAKNKATAQFVGIEKVPCRLKTAECPDHCHHAQDSAKFKIETYEEYEQVAKTGDGKKDQLIVSLSEDPEGPKSTRQEAGIIAAIKALTPGQKVRITWEHIYVSEDGSKFPQRPVRAIEPL
jgi:hypothetical protein